MKCQLIFLIVVCLQFKYYISFKIKFTDTSPDHFVNQTHVAFCFPSQ